MPDDIFDDPHYRFNDIEYIATIQVVEKTVNIHHNGRIRIIPLQFEFDGDTLVRVVVK